MKRLIPALGLLLFTAGCNKDNTDTGTPEAQATGFTLRMSSSNMMTESWGTRSAVSDGVVTFTAGDRIGIAGDNIDFAVYKALANGAETGVAAESAVSARWGAQPATFNYYAAMPAGSYADGVFSVSIPAVQQVVEGVNTTPIVAFGSGTCAYDGQRPPQAIDLTMKPYSAVMELQLPGTGQQVKSLDIAPVNEAELSGGFSAELTIAADGKATVKSTGKSLRLEFKGAKGDFLTLDTGKTLLIPTGEFQLASGGGLKLAFTLADGSILTRTICAGEAFASSAEIDGTKYYAHMKLQLSSLDQLENVLYETFGTQGNATPLETKTSTSLYQLGRYYSGYQPAGAAGKSVAYWSGMRVDVRQNAFRTDATKPDDSYLYFGNTNNNVVGGSGTITNIAGYTACADVNDRLSFYLCNVNIGKTCSKAQVSFDVKTSGHTTVTASCGEAAFYEALKSLIRVEYTDDYGDTWKDMSNAGGTSVSSDIWRYTSETIDLSGYDDEFITFRIKATMKQTLNLDNLAVDIIGAGGIVENCAPSVVAVYRQTPTTAYLECRPAASTPMSAEQIRTVVPYVGYAGAASVGAWPDYEIRNIDEQNQYFEILLKGLNTYGNEMLVALNYNGQTGGKKSFYESWENEIFNVNFDRFSCGVNPIASITLGWSLSSSISTYASPNGAGSKEYDTKYNRQTDPHNPGRREEVFCTYAANPEGGFMTGNTAQRGTNNMEAWFRTTEGFHPGGDVTTDGAISAGKFFKYDCELDGWTGLTMYELEGYMQVGTGSTKGWDDATVGNQAWICTPEIGTKAIPSGSTAAVEFSFDVAKYNNASCSQVEVIRIEGDKKTSLGTYPNGSCTAFKTNKVTIADATSRTKLLIGAPSGSTGGGRFYIDNITLRK